jgi:hypothetical protein
MSLTAGSTLQNGKYLVQATLHQSDFGVTYQAFHTLLNQIVVIQTVNSILQEHARFDQIRQQFLIEVRRLAKGHSAQTVMVRDCFEESGMPFVVLERTPGLVPAKLGEWLGFLNQIVLEPKPEAKIAPNKNSISTQAETLVPAGVTPASVTPAVTTPATIEKTAVAPVQEFKQTAPTQGGAIAPPPRNSQYPNSQYLNSQSSISPKLPMIPAKRRWLPITLAATAIVAGLTGAILSLSLRYQDSQVKGTSSLFSSEQSFPPHEDWLGEDPYANSYSDRSKTEAPADTNVRQYEAPPVARRSQRDYGDQPRYNPEPVPVPAEPTPTPVVKQIPDTFSPPADSRPIPLVENALPRPEPVAPIESPIQKTELLPPPVAPVPHAPLVSEPPTSAAPAPVSQ